MRAAAAVLALALAGCHLPVEPRPPPDEGAWAALRASVTRAGKLYDGLATNAFAQAVYLRRDVREARALRVAAWKSLTAAETDRLLAAEREDAAGHEEFLVSLFTPTPSDNDLDASSTGWRLAIVAAGAPDELPTSVVQLRPDSMLRALYPEIGDFDVTYRVRFARKVPLEGRPFVLRLAGPRGRLDFVY